MFLCSQKNSTFITKRMSGRCVAVSFVLNAKWGNCGRETSFPSRLNQTRCSRWYFEPHHCPSNATTVQLPQVQHQVVEMEFNDEQQKNVNVKYHYRGNYRFILFIISKIWWYCKFWNNYEEVKLCGSNFILPPHIKNLILVFVELSNWWCQIMSQNLNPRAESKALPFILEAMYGNEMLGHRSTYCSYWVCDVCPEHVFVV